MPQLTLAYLGFAASVAAGSWLVPRRFAAAYQAAAGLGLMAWLDPVSVPVLVALAAGLHATTGARVRGRLAHLDVVVLGLALVFCAVRVGQQAEAWFGLTSIAAPLGFGYFMLRMVHWRAEAVRGNLRAHGLVELVAYLAFFPTLVVGPIHRADTFFRWHARRRFATADLDVAFRRLLHGYVKVVVLGHWLVVQQSLFVGRIPLPALEVLFESLQYGLFLYFSFAGYSDIAIGLGRAMGYRVEENFAAPFFQRNLAAFWRAWHITLSDWCRRYVFLPVLARTRRSVLALFAAMITLGLWHELSARYLAWGAWHATGLAIFRAFEAEIAPRLPAPRSALGRALGHAASVTLTFTWVVLGFTITRTESLASAAAELATLVTGWSAQ